MIWFDDRRGRFQLDVYSGDVRGDQKWGDYGNPPFADPFFAELRSPEVQEMTGLIAQTVPDGDGFIASIEQSWLCAPKVFRYLERLILRIGNINRGDKLDITGSILQCEDTYPHMESYREWYFGFMGSLTDWLEGRVAGNDVFGEDTPIQHWLLRILRLRLRLLEKSDTFGKLSGAQEAGKTGGKRIGAFPGRTGKSG